MTKPITTNPVIIAIWAFVWQHWLSPKDKVIRVKGWRTAIVDKHGYSRQTISPCFWIFQ